MTNNNHRTKSKRIQCKDVSTLAILRFVAHCTDCKFSATVFKLDDDPRSVWTIMLPVIPMCVMKQKFENMVRKGLIDGCYCGCRGNFIITQRGRQRIALLEEVQARRTKEYLNSIYDLAGIAPGIISSRQLARELIIEVEGLIRKGQLAALDSLLGSVDFQRINFHTASGLLRTSARLRDRLDNWHPALSRFDQHLQLKYPNNREHILVGFNHLLEQEKWQSQSGQVTPHQAWKTRVADENRLILVDAQSNVIMRADSEATVAEWWTRNETLAKHTHVRVYREIDLSDYLQAEIAAKEEREAKIRQRFEEQQREMQSKYLEDRDRWGDE